MKQRYWPRGFVVSLNGERLESVSNTSLLYHTEIPSTWREYMWAWAVPVSALVKGDNRLTLVAEEVNLGPYGLHAVKVDLQARVRGAS